MFPTLNCQLCRSVQSVKLYDLDGSGAVEPLAATIRAYWQKHAAVAASLSAPLTDASIWGRRQLDKGITKKRFLDNLASRTSTISISARTLGSRGRAAGAAGSYSRACSLVQSAAHVTRASLKAEEASFKTGRA